MIVEAYLFNKMKLNETFQNTTNSAKLSSDVIAILVVVLAIAIFYTFGAVSLSWNYNNYVGSSFGSKIIFAILVFLFPSMYYPVYAWFLNPIKSLRLKSNTINNRVPTGI
jgi:hypothetical protein